jgi:hypothetical protein
MFSLRTFTAHRVRSLALLAALGTGLALAAPARAAFYYYNGDSTNIGAADVIVGSDFIMCFDNFTVATGQSWTLGGFYANFNAPSYIATSGPNNGPLPFEVQIRTGMAPGVLGTTIYGQVFYPTLTPYGTSGSDTEFHVNLEIPALATPTTLNAGTYWLGISMIGQTADEGSETYVETTTGANAINNQSDGSFLGDIYETSVRPSPINLSDGIETSAAVPEPASLSLLAVAGFSLLGLRRRS